MSQHFRANLPRVRVQASSKEQLAKRSRIRLLLVESLERRDAPGAVLPLSWANLLDSLQINKEIPSLESRFSTSANNLDALDLENDTRQNKSSSHFLNSHLFPLSASKFLGPRSIVKNKIEKQDATKDPTSQASVHSNNAVPTDSTNSGLQNPFTRASNGLNSFPNSEQSKSPSGDNARSESLSLGSLYANSFGGGAAGSAGLMVTSPISLNATPMGSSSASFDRAGGGGGGSQEGTQDLSSRPPVVSQTESIRTPSVSAGQPATPRFEDVNSGSLVSEKPVADPSIFTIDRIPQHQTGGPSAPELTLVERMPSEGASRIYVEGTFRDHAIESSVSGELIPTPQVEIILQSPGSSGTLPSVQSLGILQTKPKAHVSIESRDFAGLVLGELKSGSKVFARTVGTSSFDNVSMPFQFVPSPDSDSDGVSDRLESTAFRSDMNRDQIPDKSQPNAVSLPDARYGEWISLSTNIGSFGNVRTSMPTALSDNAKLPYGLIGFDLENVPMGGTAIVQLQLPTNSPANQYWKLDPVSKELVDFRFDGMTGAKLETGVFQLYLRDGGRGDADGIANGRIVDPGGPGTAPFNMFSIPQSSWNFQQSGGTLGNASTWSNQRMIEGDSFLASLSTSWTVPTTASALQFDFRLGFDRDAAQINDALEFGFVDSLGNSIVPTFASNRDSFLNLSEGQEPAFGNSTILSTERIGNEWIGHVSLNLAAIPAGTSGTFFVRLINNDNFANDDDSSFVRLYFQNSAPVANNDNYSTLEDTPLSISAPGVLSNDSDSDADLLKSVIVQQPSFGTVSLQESGSFLYTPNSNYFGNDSFTYTANDGFLSSSNATVSIAVVPVNDAPVAVDDNYSVRLGQSLQISATRGVLKNDYDLENTPLSVLQVVGSTFGPSNGTVNLLADGSFSYTPNAGFTGNDFFTYRASDGTDVSSPVKVNLRISPTVSGVFADSTLWNNNFTHAALGYPLVGNTRNLPWFNLNQIRVRFSEPIAAVSSNDIFISGSSTRAIDYNTGLLIARPDPRTLEITLRSGLVFSTDKVQLTLLDTVRDTEENLIDGNGDGTPGDPYNLAFNVVRGDVNNSGTVLSSDVTLVTRAQSGIGTYNPLMDVNGSATILSNDVTLVTRNQSGLVTAEPSLSSLIAPSAISNPTPSSKFFVPDSIDGSVYRYASDGISNRYMRTATVSNVKGSAMTAAGDLLWLVDAIDNVRVFEPATGIALGNWKASGDGTSEGITVWGNDIWTVSSGSDRVYRFQDGARRMSGVLDPISSFALDSANTQPTGIVTNGIKFWVSDSLVDRMFVYDLNGASLGSWPLDPTNTHATGVTLNPAGGADLWTVDKGTRKIYTYSGGLNWLSPSQAQSASTLYNLNPENSDPEDIADPPPMTNPMRWISTSGGNWNSASNWDLGRVPTINDDVIIDVPNANFTVDINGQANARSLYSVQSIRVLSGGVFNIASTSEITNLRLESGGTLDGNGNVAVTNSFAWNGGTLRGTGDFEITLNATGGISSSSVKNLNRTLINRGQITASSNLFLGSNASFQNLATGDFRIVGDADLLYGDSNRALLPRPFANFGTLRKVGGTDESTLHLALTNHTTGSVILDSGTLRINAGVTNAGNVAIGASSQLVTFSTQTAPAIATIGFQQTAGTTKLEGGTLSAPSSFSNGIQLSGGVLSGTGSLLGNIRNEGEVRVGSTIGILNVAGNYTQTSAGLLALDWQSDVPNSGYDQLKVVGSVSLNGSIAINRTGIPITVNEVVFIDNDGVEGIVGTFTNLPNNGIVMLDGRNYRANYAGNGSNSNDFTLVVDAPMLSVKSLRQPESQTSFNFTVSLSRPTTDTVTVKYFTSDDSAVAPSDFQVQSGTLQFEPGQISQTVSIAVVNDSVSESSERFMVNLHEPQFAGIAQAVAKGTILDDDSGPITRDNLGTDFWLTFPTNLGDAGPAAGLQNLYLFITSPHNTSGTVTIPGLGFSQSFAVEANKTTTVPIPNSADPRGVSGVINNLGIRVQSGKEVAVYGLNQISQTTDAFTGIPLDILDTEYVVLGWKNTSNNAFAQTQINFVATENNTTVSITPRVPVLGRLAGVPYTVNLNAGQSYQLQAPGIPLDLSGTILTSNEPIAVFGGHSCANIPTNIPLCDFVVEQIPPTSTWGTNFYTVPLATRFVGDTVRVIASQNDTSISINGDVVKLIQKGEVYETLLSQASRIKTNRPVLVAQYANGQGFDNANADPFMMLIPPSEQFLTNYTVSTPASNFAANYMNVVIPTVAVGTLKMDGSPLASSLFTPIPRTNHSSAQLFVPVGSHNFTSDVPFGIYSYGFNVYDSYGYPGGMALANLADVKSLFLTPTRDESQVGVEHTVYAWATDQNGSRLTGVRIDFDVAGTHSKLGYVFTDASGVATFRYTGTQLGTDLITASIGDLTQTAKKKWISPPPTIAIHSPGNQSKHQAHVPVLISGQANPAISAARIVAVTMNGSSVDALDVEGNFFVRVQPQVGQTSYSFTAIDSYGASATTTISLEGLDPSDSSDILETLSELSSIQVNHGITSWDERADILYSNIEIVNKGQYPIKAPLVIGLTNISNSRIVPNDVDGFTPQGIPFYNLSRFIPSNTLSPNQKSGRGLISFYNPTQAPFTFETVLLAQLNRAPNIVSAPVTSVISGSSYRYDVEVLDPDRDPVSMQLLAGPIGMRFSDNSLRWVPTSSDVGNHNIVVSVSDGYGATTRQSFVLNVSAPVANRAPAFTSIPIVSVRLGEEYEYNLSAADADGDSISFASEGLPSGMILNAGDSTAMGATAKLSWKPTAVDVGSNLISLVASDNKPNSRSSQQFQLQVLPELGNRAPEFTSVPITRNLAGQPYFYTAVAIDPDRDELTYRLVTAPNGMTVGTSTGNVSWHPLVVNAGFHPIEIEVSDGRGWKSIQSYSLEVINTMPGNLSGSVFFDSDGDGIRTSNEQPQANWTVYLDANQNNRLDVGERTAISNTNGEFILGNITPGAFTLSIVMQTGWAPTLPASQRYQGTILANQTIDNLVFGNTSRATNNSSPDFTSSPNSSATQGKRYRYTPTAVDSDGDTLTYSLEYGPSGMVIDPTSGTLSWFVDTTLTESRVTLKVDDGQGGSDLQSFTLVIHPNEYPYFTSTPIIKAIVGAPYSYDANVLDPDDPTSSLRFRLDSDSLSRGMAIHTTTGIVSWSNPSLGLYPVVITVVDPLGAPAIQRYDLAVNASNVNRPPQIQSNPSGQIERGRTFVHAIQAFDPDNDSLTYSVANAPAGMTLDGSGTLRWTPSLSQLGSNVFTIIASDGALSHSRAITLTVANHASNDAPRFTTQPPVSALVDKPFFYDADAVDPEGDTLRFELVTAPSGMTINERTGLVDWSPITAQVGVHPITLRVSDMRGGSTEQSATIDVTLHSRPPVINSSPITATPINKPYNYSVRATDPDGGTIQFHLGTRTTAVGIDLEMDSKLGLLSWTPKSLGTFAIEIVAEDEQGLKATQLYELTVSASDANQPPRITSTPSFFAEVGLQYSYDLDATDPDSTNLTYRLLTPSAIPPNASFNPATGLLLWTPASNQLNQSVLYSVRVSDGQLNATQSFEVKVIPANVPPILQQISNGTIIRGDNYLVDVSATDLNNDPLTFRLDAASIAAGLYIDAERGRISWQTVAIDSAANPATALGARVVTVTASDGRATASQSFTLNVIADTVSPSVTIGATDLAGKQLVAPRVGDEILLFLSAKDNVGIESRTLTLVSVTRNGVTSPRNEILTLDAMHSVRLRITPDLIGQLLISGSAIDPSGNVGNATPFSMIVVDPNDVKAPIAQILGGPHFTLSEPTDIRANVSDDSPLLNWKLQLLDNETRRSTVLATGIGDVQGAAIARIDTTFLRNGAYTLVLTAVDSGANTTSDSASVQIEGALKLGNFTVAFNDLTVPVAGVPITLTRRYDSLDAGRSGDFGFGWSLEIATTKIEKQIDPDRIPDLSGYVPFRDGDRVVVTLPDGTKEGFTFYGMPGTGFLGLVLDYVPAFVADFGVKSKLVVDSVTLKKVGEDYLDYASGRLYNPADPTFGGSYELKLRNGSSLVINARTGELTTLVDRVGNEVSIGPDGFISKAGRGIAFERDWANRITAVIDPRGKRIEYTYDGVGDLVSMTNRVGATTRYTYVDNRPHFLESIVDALGRTAAAATFAPDGRFHSLTNASGQSATAAYDIGARTQSVTDANGFVTTETRDARGNVTRTVDPTGVIAKTSYDSKGNVLGQTQVIGLDDSTSGETNDLTTTNVYDTDFNLIERKDVFGNSTRMSHDEHGALTATVDTHGNTSRTIYNSNGTVAFTVDADGNQSRFQTNETGNITQSRDRNNNLLFDAVYNSFGEMTSVTPGEGRPQSIVYDDNGNNVASWSLDGTAPNQVQSLRLSRYNDDNKVIATFVGRLPAGNHILANFDTAVIPAPYLISSSQTQFDAIGQASSSTSDSNLLSQTTRDIDGRIIETRTQQRATGTSNSVTWFVTRTVYDTVGRTIAVTDSYPEGLPPSAIEATRTEYDPAGRVTASYRVLGIQIDLIGPINSQQSRIVSPGILIPNTRKTDTYDSSGRGFLSTDGYGRETRSVFNAKGQTVETRTQSTTESGQNVWLVTRTVFDSQGRPVLSTDQYIDTGLSSVSPPVFASNSLYDDRGRSIGSRRVSGATITLLGNETFISNPGEELSRTRTEYDSQGRAFRQIGADGQVTMTEYDSRGREIATLGMHVLATSVGLANRGPNDFVRLRSETRFNNRGQAFQSITGIAEYGTVVNGVFIKSPIPSDTDRSMQSVTESVYDDLGRVVKTILPDGTFTSSEYDSKGRVTAEIDQLGNRKEMSYDIENRLAKVMLPAVPDPRNNNALTRPTYQYEYNVYGQMSKLTDANNHVTHFGFDSIGQATSRTLPEGHSESMSYDNRKRLVLEISFEGTHKRTIYDDSTAGAGRIARYDLFASSADYNAYITTGSLATDVKWERVSMTYDAFNRIASTTHVYASGANGSDPISIRVTDRWENRYDLQGRLIRESSPTGAIEYEYDNLGRKIQSRALVPSASGPASSPQLSSAVVYTYDSLGRLSTVTATMRDGVPMDTNMFQPGDQPELTQYYFDLLGRMDYVELPNAVVEDYTFDKMDRLDVMRYYQADSNNAFLADNVLKSMFDYTYQANGKRTELTETFGHMMPASPSGSVLSNSFVWSYDQAGRLVSETLDSSDNAVDQTETYLMDLVGNRIRRLTDKPGTANDMVDTYSYDSSDRLITEKKYALPLPLANDWSESASIPAQTTTYGWTGTQQTAKLVTSSSSVQPTVSSLFAYGLMGQLEQVVTENRDSSNALTSRTKVDYRYDTKGHRFVATDFSFNSQTSIFEHRGSIEYLIDHTNMTGYGQSIVETVKNGVGQATKRITYTFGQDEITQSTVAFDSLGQASSTTNQTFGHDGHGSVRVLFEATTALEQLFTYSAYGELLSIHNGAGSPISNPSNVALPHLAITSLLYNGEGIDSRTGLYNFRARWYSASIGRFERLDPFAGNPNDPFSFNKYGFVHSDPVMGIDPSGNDLMGLMVGIAIRVGNFALNAGLAYLGFTSAVKYEGSTKPIVKFTPRQRQEALKYAWLTVAAYKASKTDGNLERIKNDGWDDLTTFEEDTSGYRAVLFKNIATGESVMSYAGTDDFPDVITDAWQGLLGGTTQYERAITDSLAVKHDFGKIDHFTGHSLGGGLASLAALANRRPATTFNGAGLHSWTTDAWGIQLENAEKSINAYRVQGDFLSTIQDASPAYMAAGLLPGYATLGVALVGLAGAIMPNGVGTSYWVPPTSFSIWNRHKMLSDVIPGIIKA